ncbi:MAG TPA: SRPBCC family protein [Thermoanaerobaculia bacterium]|nr:SRPBCC family protein [Thermoanaerobaculia bacterium]
MPRILPALALLSALPAAGSGGDLAALIPELTPPLLARLEAGEVVTRLIPIPGEKERQGLAARLLAAPPERLFRALADPDHWPEWVPFLERSERPNGPAGAPVWSLAFDLPLPLRDRHYRARVTTSEPAGEGAGLWTVSWDSVPGSGNIASARGAFTLARHGPKRTLVVFRTATDTGDHTPRILQERALLKSLPWLLDGLRQQAGRCRYSVPWADGCLEARPWAPR